MMVQGLAWFWNIFRSEFHSCTALKNRLADLCSNFILSPLGILCSSLAHKETHRGFESKLLLVFLFESCAGSQITLNRRETTPVLPFLHWRRGSCRGKIRHRRRMPGGGQPFIDRTHSACLLKVDNAAGFSAICPRKCLVHDHPSISSIMRHRVSST